MNLVTLCQVEDTLIKQPKSVARRVIETFSEQAEEEIILRVPDGPVRGALLKVITDVRKEDEIRSWNRSS